MVQGEGNIKYTYNNGIMANDPKLAARNFLSALEKIPGYMEKEQKSIAEFQKDLPILQEVVSDVWPKEDKLNELKRELAAVERKIQLSIAPEPKENENQEETITANRTVQEKSSVGLRAI